MSRGSSGELARCRETADRWTRDAARHLLWRTQHGASERDIQQACAEGLDATVGRLLSPQEESLEFAAADKVLYRVAADSGEIEDWKVWWAHRLLASANPLHEKMTLFWHSHFATSNAKVRSAQHMADQNVLFRRHALGNFRDLMHGIARDVAMLIWLDGNANRNRSPNENFARELMELFCLGVGNYTEQDIRDAARAFTGWHVRQGAFWFNQLQHDAGMKTVLGRTGQLDGDDVIEICLEQHACPCLLAGKLLRLLVMQAPSDEVVDEMADSIRAHDYDMQPVMRQLLTSQLFFSPAARHSLIKSPADFVLGSQRTLSAKANLSATVRTMDELGQNLLRPPTVEGWVGGRSWINSATLLQRTNFVSGLLLGEAYGQLADPAEIARQQGWTRHSQAVDYFAQLLIGRDVTSRSSSIQEHLQELSGNLGSRLRGMIHLMMTIPEYQLM